MTLSVNEWLPVFPDGMATLIGENVNEASEITTKPDIEEVRLYLLGLLEVAVNGNSKGVAALQILLIEPRVIVGFWFTTIICVDEARLLQPFTIQIALYVPEAETVIVVALVPFDQTTVPTQSLTLNFTFVPAHTILSSSSDVTVGAEGIGFTLIVVSVLTVWQVRFVVIWCSRATKYDVVELRFGVEKLVPDTIWIKLVASEYHL